MINSKKFRFTLVLVLILFSSLTACSAQIGEALLGGGNFTTAAIDGGTNIPGGGEEISLDDDMIDVDSFTNSPGNGVTGDYDNSDPNSDSNVDENETGPVSIAVRPPKEDCDPTQDTAYLIMYPDNSSQFNLTRSNTTTAYRMMLPPPPTEPQRTNGLTSTINAQSINELQEGEVHQCRKDPDEDKYTWQKAN